MKSFIYFLLFFGFFIIMLLFPGTTFLGAQEGLLLWFQTVLPTLLPFVILSNLLIRTNCITYITKIISPFLTRIFKTSAAGCYAILIGFLCGYPMGAKVINDLICRKKISCSEGQYLLSFCNNTSPMFIIGFVVTQNFKNKLLIIPTLLISILSPVLCSFIFRHKYKSNLKDSIINSDDSAIHFQFSLLDEAIMNGFETITKIGGYIILFSIVFKLLAQSFPWFLLPILEITNGIPFILERELPFLHTYIITLANLSFGGLCAFAQTKSMIQSSKLSMLSYTQEKLITAMVTSLLAYLYVLLFFNKI